MDALWGEIAALLSAAMFSAATVGYTFAGRKVGAVACMALSLPISWLAIAVLHRLTLGEFFPVGAGADRWLYLGLSGILAFGVSSYFLLRAYQSIGPRLTMLIGSFGPVLGAALAWAFLGQALDLGSMIGISVVIFGIVWVVAERGKTVSGGVHVHSRIGILHACLAMVTQGVSFVLTTRGLVDAFPPFSAALIRLTAAIIGLWVIIAVQRNVRSTATIFGQDRIVFLQLTWAGLAGPVAAGSLLLVALQTIPVGIATTLSNTTSIMLIPVAHFIFKERITMRAIAGTVVTVVGIAILFV
ncbi:MAG: DMT family transporter [Anaerolineae bacterium]|nr:DMT family transporter [Anaerolineae bacterium]